ncbi:hypothetical protein QCA50_009235 [Cerrena zonata]|uniref:Uncharacterized protein n=1 Tax=Cerrena zonata TaxID=2478898 RepID=A0AAW0GEC4_9APHY
MEWDKSIGRSGGTLQLSSAELPSKLDELLGLENADIDDLDLKLEIGVLNSGLGYADLELEDVEAADDETGLI